METPERSWPHSPIPDTLEWSRRCAARLLVVEPGLEPSVAQTLADDMAHGAHYRALLPEDAVDSLVKPVMPRKAW